MHDSGLMNIKYLTAAPTCPSLTTSSILSFYRNRVNKNGVQILVGPLDPRSLRLYTLILGDSASILDLSTMVRAPIAWSLL